MIRRSTGELGRSTWVVARSCPTRSPRTPLRRRSARPTAGPAPSQRSACAAACTVVVSGSERTCSFGPVTSGPTPTSCSPAGRWRCSSTAASGTAAQITSTCPRATGTTGCRSWQPTSPGTVGWTMRSARPVGRSFISGSTSQSMSQSTGSRPPSRLGEIALVHVLVVPPEVALCRACADGRDLQLGVERVAEVAVDTGVLRSARLQGRGDVDAEAAVHRDQARVEGGVVGGACGDPVEGSRRSSSSDTAQGLMWDATSRRLPEMIGARTRRTAGVLEVGQDGACEPVLAHAHRLLDQPSRVRFRAASSSRRFAALTATTVSRVRGDSSCCTRRSSSLMPRGRGSRAGQQG